MVVVVAAVVVVAVLRALLGLLVTMSLHASALAVALSLPRRWSGCAEAVAGVLFLGRSKGGRGGGARSLCAAPALTAVLGALVCLSRRAAAVRARPFCSSRVAEPHPLGCVATCLHALCSASFSLCASQKMLLLAIAVSLCLALAGAQTTGTEVTTGQTPTQLTNQASRLSLQWNGLLGESWRKSQLTPSEAYLVFSTDASTNVCPNVPGTTTCFPSLYSVSTYAASGGSGVKKLSGTTASTGLGVEPSWVISPAEQVRGACRSDC